MGLLDMLGNLSPEQTQGLLAAAAQISEASGPSRVKPNVMGALAQGGLAYQNSIDGQRRKKLEEEAAQQALKINGYKMRDAESDYEKQQRTREAELKYADYMKSRAGGGGLPAAPGAQVANPMQQGAAAGGAAGFALPTAQDKVAEAQELYKLGLVDQAKAAMAEAIKLKPEYSQSPQVATGPDGKPFTYVLDKDGNRKILDGVLPREKMETLNLGNREQVINPYDLKPGQSFQRTMTPDGIAADARARQSNALKQQELAAGGKAPSGYRWKANGELEAIPGGPASLAAKMAKAPTEFQGKSGIFGARAEEADRIVSGMTGKYDPSSIAAKTAVEDTWLVGGAMGAAVNKFGMKPNDQVVEQAQRDFINAVLRQESGAAIGKDEFQNARRQYFPEVGDSPEKIAQKERNRKLSVEGLKRNAGPAAFSGPAPAKPAAAAGGWSITKVN